MDLEYKDLKIRKTSLEDAGLLLNWWNDGSVMAFAGYPDGKKTKEVIIRHYIDHDTKHYRHIIEYKGEPIGEINYRDTNDQAASLSVMIAEEGWQNKGLGKIILSLFIDVLFRDYGFKKINIETFKSNPRSIHVAESLGFKKLKDYQDNRHDTRGKPMSTIEYQLIEDDFISYI